MAGISFIIGLLLGGTCAILIHCLLIIGREEIELEEIHKEEMKDL